MIKVFDREEFVGELFEMEAEYMKQFGLWSTGENEEGELDIWFKVFNSKEERDTFTDHGDTPF